MCSGCNQMESWAQGQFCHLAKCALHSGWRATETERTRESCKRPSRLFAQFLLWIKNFTHKLHSLFYWTQVQSLPCQFVKIDKWISLLFYELRYESSTLILCKELSSTIFQSCQSVVRHPRHLSRSPLCSIYKGINAFF